MKKKIVYSEPDCGGIQPKPLTVKAKYIEPANYFPEETRKKFRKLCSLFRNLPLLNPFRVMQD